MNGSWSFLQFIFFTGICINLFRCVLGQANDQVERKFASIIMKLCSSSTLCPHGRVRVGYNAHAWVFVGASGFYLRKRNDDM